MADWGPDNPHPLSRLKTELVWEGKYDEYGNRRPVRLPDCPLPLQRIETIDEPRDREKARQLSLFDEDAFHRSAHRDDWRNMLIWGDNKLVMASLLEQFRGKIDLIYIDPPFDVGADFTMQVQIGDDNEKVQKEQSILEAVAYRDTWGRGTDSYLHMMYERLTLMRDLLCERGSIVVHVDWRVASVIKLILDEVFGYESFINEIIWYYTGAGASPERFSRRHDNLFWYSKSDEWYFDPDPLRTEYAEATKERFRHHVGNVRQGRDFGVQQLNPKGKHPDDVIKISIEAPSALERTGFPTQKPLALMQKLVEGLSPKNGIIADFFCGSGTTIKAAELLGRKWVASDLSRYAIHTTRKRLIQVQRELHEKGQPYRSFDVYNLGRYERQWWQLERLQGADTEHRRIVLAFY
ncbi:MAG: site-specific DNA-methyltransferase, partial [Chloroflexi bacterium]